MGFEVTVPKEEFNEYCNIEKLKVNPYDKKVQDNILEKLEADNLTIVFTRFLP